MLAAAALIVLAVVFRPARFVRTPAANKNTAAAPPGAAAIQRPLLLIARFDAAPPSTFRTDAGASRLPKQTGAIVAVHDGDVDIDLGSLDGLKRGMGLHTMHAAGDARTGSLLTIAAVFRERSRGRITNGTGVQPGDRVDVDPSVHVEAILAAAMSRSASGDVAGARTLAQLAASRARIAAVSADTRRLALHQLGILERQTGDLSEAGRLLTAASDEFDTSPAATPVERADVLNEWGDSDRAARVRGGRAGAAGGAVLCFGRREDARDEQPRSGGRTPRRYGDRRRTVSASAVPRRPLDRADRRAGRRSARDRTKPRRAENVSLITMSQMLRRTGLTCAIAMAVCQSVSVAQAPASQENNWQALDRHAADLYEKGDLPQAIEAAQAALAVAASPRETGRSLDRLGFLYYTSGKLTDGEAFLRKSLHTCESAFGVDSLEYAEAANDLAMLLRDLTRMDEAKALARRAVETRQHLLGDTALPLAESLNTLATVSAMSGDYATGVGEFERAMAIHESRPAPERDTEEYGTLCINLAGTYQRLGKYTEAEATFQKGLDSLRVKPGVQHPAYAASLLAAAALKVDLGRYSDAERMYDEGARLVRAELGERHPVYATLLNNRGFFYQSIGNFAAAEAGYRASLELKLKIFGLDSPVTISSLRNLAHLTYPRDHREGERLLAQAVDAYARLSKPPPFDFASVLVGLARAQRDRGALPDARATAVRALEVSRAGLGERHPLFASALREM